MSNEAVVLALDERSVSGKKVKQLRAKGLVPVVIHEKGQESLKGAAPILDVERMYRRAGKHHTVELTIGSTKKLAFVKDITTDPVKNTFTHVVFHAIKANEKTEAEVPLKMVGQAPALVAGLLVRLNMDHLVIKGLPANIPDVIEVDVSGVSTHNDDVREGALTIPSNVEVVDFDPERVIVSVTVPRAEVEKQHEEEVAAAEVPSDNGGEKTDKIEPKE